MNENTYKLISVVLLCSTILSGVLTIYYNYQLKELENDYKTLLGEFEDFTALIDIMIDYGNGTIAWYNNTRISIGSSVLDATILACEVEYQIFNYGSFVTKINGLEQDASHFWLWSIYDNDWVMGSVGADMYNIHDDDIIGWTYTSF